MNINNVTQTLRLREYYYMAVRHKGVFFLTIASSLIIALTLALAMPKIYRAETVLLVEDEKILNPLISGLAISPSVSARMRTLREELLSWPRLTLLVEKLDLDKHIKDPLEYEKLINNLRDNIHIKFRGSELIIIAYEGQIPRKAQDVVQTLSDIIAEGTLTSVNLEANTAIQFIQEQLDLYKVKLEESEERLREFREIYSKSLPIATQMNEQIVALKIQLSNLLVDNTEEHPRVIQTRKLIDELEKQRDEFMEEAAKEGLDIDPAQYAKLVSSVPYQEQKMAQLQRDYFVNESVYQKLLQRLETAKISQTLEESDSGAKFRVLDPARLPLAPVKPNKLLYLLAGFFIGLGLGAVLVYVIELSDNSIRNVDEARSLLEMPIFGSVSTILPEELLMGERLRKEINV